jgi:hypothetical protein
MAAEITLGTGMSCISSVCRGEDNGSDNENNLDYRQQGRTPKCALREKRNNPDGQTFVNSRFRRKKLPAAGLFDNLYGALGRALSSH